MSEPASSSPANNSRLSKRRPPKGRVRAVCRLGALDLGPDLAVAVLDLSETGVRLVVKEALTPGREVLILLRREANIRPVRRVGDVVWSLAAADGVYCVGVRFQKRVPYGDFSQLTLESLPHAPDRPTSPASTSGGNDARTRRTERHSPRRLVRCRLSVAAGRPDLDATILDVSETGASLMASGPLQVGEVVALGLHADRARQPPPNLTARVVYAVEVNLGGFLAGMEFDQPLPKAVLTAVLEWMGCAPTAGT